MKFWQKSLIFTAILGAQNAWSASIPEVILPDVLVTPSRTETNVNDTLASTILIDRAEIERNPTAEISDLLRQYAGISVARAGGTGQQTSVFIRGAESRHTLVLIDGIQQSGGISAFDLSTINLDTVERIEIVKAPRSTQYGSDAIGGIVHIITRKTGKRPLELRFGAGSNGTGEVSIHGNYRGDNLKARVGISSLHSRGTPTFVGSTEERGFSNLTLEGAGRYSLGENAGLDFSARLNRGEIEYLDSPMSAKKSRDFDQKNISVGGDWQINKIWYTNLRGSVFKSSSDENQSNGFVNIDNQIIDWENRLVLSDEHSIVAGVQHKQEEISGRFVMGNLFGNNLQTQALYVQHQWTGTPDFGLLGARYNRHETFGTEVTYSAEYGRRFGEETTVSASINTGFRAPDAGELSGYGGSFGYIANPNLKPETSRNYELALRHDFKKYGEVKFNIFYNQIEDLITGFPQFLNINEARIRGTELKYQWLRDKWRLNTEMSYLRAEDSATGKQLLRRAKEQGSVQIVRKIGPVDLSTTYLYVGKRNDIDAVTFANIENNGYGLVNLGATWHINNKCNLNARVENVLNKKYQAISGYQGLDTAAFVNMSCASR